MFSLRKLQLKWEYHKFRRAIVKVKSINELFKMSCMSKIKKVSWFGFFLILLIHLNYLGVSNLGSDAYTDAQNIACESCCCEGSLS